MKTAFVIVIIFLAVIYIIAIFKEHQKNKILNAAIERERQRKIKRG